MQLGPKFVGTYYGVLWPTMTTWIPNVLIDFVQQLSTDSIFYDLEIVSGFYFDFICGIILIKWNVSF